MSNTVTITDDSFQQDVLSSDKPVLVDFWATWCGPCKMIAPVLEEIAGEHSDKLTIAKLDIDANPGAARDFQVMSIPTLILFKDGKPIKHDRRHQGQGRAAEGARRRSLIDTANTRRDSPISWESSETIDRCAPVASARPTGHIDRFVCTDSLYSLIRTERP